MLPQMDVHCCPTTVVPTVLGHAPSVCAHANLGGRASSALQVSLHDADTLESSQTCDMVVVQSLPQATTQHAMVV